MQLTLLGLSCFNNGERGKENIDTFMKPSCNLTGHFVKLTRNCNCNL
jgi:hypothetical protein